MKFLIYFFTVISSSSFPGGSFEDSPIPLISPDYGVLKLKDLYYFDPQFSWICFKDVKIKAKCVNDRWDDHRGALGVLEIEIRDRYAIHEMGLSRHAIEPEYCSIMKRRFLEVTRGVPFCMLAWDFSDPKEKAKGKYDWGFEKFKSKKGELGYWEMAEYLDSLEKKKRRTKKVVK